MRVLNNKKFHVTCLNKNKDRTLSYEDIILLYTLEVVDKSSYVTQGDRFND